MYLNYLKKENILLPLERKKKGLKWFSEQNTFPCMVLILEGSLDHGAHIWSNPGISISLKELGEAAKK